MLSALSRSLQALVSSPLGGKLSAGGIVLRFLGIVHRVAVRLRVELDEILEG